MTSDYCNDLSNTKGDDWCNEVAFESSIDFKVFMKEFCKRKWCEDKVASCGMHLILQIIPLMINIKASNMLFCCLCCFRHHGLAVPLSELSTQCNIWRIAICVKYDQKRRVCRRSHWPLDNGHYYLWRIFLTINPWYFCRICWKFNIDIRLNLKHCR